MSQKTSSPATFLIIFGLPFALIGLVPVVQSLLRGDNPMMALGGLPFALVGLGLIGIGIGVRTYFKRQAALEERYPDEPWRRRADWSEGVIRTSSGTGVLALGGFTLFWNAVAWPVAIVPFVHPGGNKSAIPLILIFPAVGLILAIATAIALLRHLHWGRSVLRLESFPPRLGSELIGKIELKRPLHAIEATRLHLFCESITTTGTGKERKQVRNVLWEDSRHIEPGELAGLAMHIPVRMVLPSDQPTFTSGQTPAIEWTLDVSARLNGPNFHGVFKLPVIEAAEGAAPVVVRTDPVQAERALAYEDPSIVVTPLAGSLRIDFPRGRHKGMSLAFLLFGLLAITVGACVGIFGLKGSFIDCFILIFPVVFGGIGSLMLYFSLHMLFAWSRITVSRSAIELEGRGLLRSTMKLIDASSISTLDIKSNASANQAKYYDIELMTITGEKHVLGRMIKGQPAARGLLDRINKAMGRDVSTTAPPL